MTINPGIRISKVTKSFDHGGGRPIISDFSLDILPGEFVAILGPSGCGKTTMLRLVDGLLQPDAGTLTINGAPPQPGPKLGFVFQSFRLVPWATASRNVGFGLELAGVDAATRNATVSRLLQRVGLSQVANSYPAQLSGGMKQRVALARALATDPEILLLDEPFASLDAQTREIMQLELLQLWEERSLTTLFVTHSVEEAVLLADKVVVMGPAPRSLREIVPIDLPRPRRDEIRTSATFMEHRTYLTGLIREMILNDPNSPFFRPGKEASGS
ncbi:MAG TPA: ABC transporter ATP-binding protein [Devosia sp.]|uniref:ABC transporter ATP-binding protein n=1 Tax=Devosia sp. TaxID=1871048 RepID=UPI002F920C29